MPWSGGGIGTGGREWHSDAAWFAPPPPSHKREVEVADDLMRETRMRFLTPMVTVFACTCATAAFAAQATFYQLPPGDNPHDVAPAADGTVWYSGQQKGILGRFDPKTGKKEEIPLGPGAAPHGVIIGPDGAAPGPRGNSSFFPVLGSNL